MLMPVPLCWWCRGDPRARAIAGEACGGGLQPRKRYRLRGLEEGKVSGTHCRRRSGNTLRERLNPDVVLGLGCNRGWNRIVYGLTEHDSNS